MLANILWVEGNRGDSPSFVPALRKKGFQVMTVSTGKAALNILSKEDFDVVVVYAASMRTSGKRICLSLTEALNGRPLLMIQNPDRPIVGSAGADVMLQLPFTIRKLVNRIKPFLPGESARLLKTGPIHLDLARRQVRCEGREEQLTPRLASLLRMFMLQPGVVLERKQVFRKVWNTAYTGDTRTLDVHISWLRRAIEENPRKPRFLKTIRGVGYRLDV